VYKRQSVYHDDSSPPFDGTNSVWSRYNGSWTDFTSVDNSFKLYLATDGSKPTDVQDNSLLVEKDTARRYWFDAGAESNVELTTGAPFTAHATGWQGKAYVSELSDLPNVGDVVTGGKIYVGTSAGNVRLGLYSDNGSGVPQTLLAETASTAVGSAGAWQEIDFISSYTTTSTDKLHLGLQTDSSGSGFGYATNVSLARSEMVTSYGAFPTTFSGTSDNTPADLRAVVERPAAPTWSLEGLEKFYDTTATASNADLIMQVASAGHGTRVGVKILSGSTAIGKYIQNIKFKLSKFSSPSGNYQITVRDSSDVVKATANFSATGLPTSATIIDHDIGSPVKLAEGDRILYEYGGASGTKFWYNNSSGVSGFAVTYYNYSSAYVDDSTDQVIGAMDSQQ
jgi:hypothetical protein